MAPKRKAENGDPSHRPLKRMKMLDGTPASTKANSAADSSMAPANLFSLPAEIRNEIYELALIENNNIHVTKDLEEPGLLSVNLQIRSEATEMWYYQNTFEVEIVSCNPGLLAPFMRFIQPMEIATGKGVRVLCRLRHNVPNWAHLMGWCRVIHRYGGPLRPRDSEGGYRELLGAAQAIADSHRGRSSWNRCLRTLQSLRLAAGKLDPRWLED